MQHNHLICITLIEQIKNNRTCLIKGVQHDYMTLNYFETREELEVEAEFVKNLIKSKPIYKGIDNRIYVK
jgi:hypothetical protein